MTSRPLLQPANPPVRYPPPSKCIYCERDDTVLTDEHIIPSSLAGNYIFQDASCTACADKINHFETRLGRHYWWAVRTTLGFKSRKNEYAEHGHIGVRRATGIEWVAIPLDEYPRDLYLNQFAPCRLLQGLPEFSSTTFIARKWRYGEDYKTFEERMAPKYGRNFIISRFHPALFARLLSKIAHAYALAHVDRTEFIELYLPPLVLGESNNYGHWVGGTFDLRPPQSDVLHELQLQERSVNSRLYLVCQIRLFALFGAPDYHAVVGRLR